jgi:hypothetical protein
LEFVIPIEQQFGQVFKLLLSEAEKETARARFERHFGALNLEHTIDLNNESIDVDLAISFYKDITLFVFAVVAFLRQNYAESNPKIELLYKQLKADIISSGIEYINLFNPSETAWENTKIVKLLRLAETNTDKIGDMTLLARAGDCTNHRFQFLHFG